MTVEAVLQELEGMRVLARALVANETDADDLVQEGVLTAIERPPSTDRSIRPWLAVVLRNRRRMDVRAERRAQARHEAVAALTPPVELPDELLDRARGLARVAEALVALEEPYQSVVIRHYLGGDSAADIAKQLGVPASTIRWQLMTGRDRLRAALVERDAGWRRVLVPIVPVAAKSGAWIFAVVAAAMIAGATGWWLGGRGGEDAAPVAAIGAPQRVAAPIRPRASEPVVELPGDGRAVVEKIEGAGAVVGHVINWATGEGVAGAELTFASEDGAVGVRSDEAGGFELMPGRGGRFALEAITAPGFVPCEPMASNMHFEVRPDRVIRGVVLFMFPAVKYRGMVVDRAGAPVAGARVRAFALSGGEQVLDEPGQDLVSGPDGRFTLHAGDGAVIEAVRGTARGWGKIDNRVALKRELTIAIDDVAPRDATISGRVVDSAGEPVADVVVSASPDGMEADKLSPGTTRGKAEAVSLGDGTFTLEGLDHGEYHLATQADGLAPTLRKSVVGGSRDVALVVAPGVTLVGSVIGPDGPVPAFTLLAWRIQGALRELMQAHLVVDAAGRFELRVAPGNYELVAAARGWAPSAPKAASAGERGVRLVVSAGATLRGTVTDIDGKPIAHARITRELQPEMSQLSGGGALTRSDGGFELTGIPDGPVSVSVEAPGFHPRIEAGLTAWDGAALGPVTIVLAPLAPGEQPLFELVGIGISLGALGDAARVDRVYPGSGAEAAGLVVGDVITAVDGVAIAEVGVDRAIARIRGRAGTTVPIVLRRGEAALRVEVERRKLRL